MLVFTEKQKREFERWANETFFVFYRDGLLVIDVSDWIADPDEWYEREVARMKERAPA